MNLIDIIKTIPMKNFAKIGFVIDYADIYAALKSKGFENKDILDCQLRKLYNDGLIDLFHVDGFDEDLIYAIRLK